MHSSLGGLPKEVGLDPQDIGIESVGYDGRVGAGQYRQRAPKATPGPAWPETGGLLPFGSTSNGDVLYWRTRGAPAAWTVVIQERGGDMFFDSGCNLATFLSRAIEEEFQARFLLPSYLQGRHLRPRHRFAYATSASGGT